MGGRIRSHAGKALRRTMGGTSSRFQGNLRTGKNRCLDLRENIMLQSCQNCWFNGLQYGALGLSVGYCSQHRKILNAAEATTCGLHMRKDLPLRRTQQVSSIHAARYPDSIITLIHGDKEAMHEISSDEKDLHSLRSDSVAELVSDYGMLDSKIESLAQLSSGKSTPVNDTLYRRPPVPSTALARPRRPLRGHRGAGAVRQGHRHRLPRRYRTGSKGWRQGRRKERRGRKYERDYTSRRFGKTTVKRQ